jgi:hypothetical protein
MIEYNYYSMLVSHKTKYQQTNICNENVYTMLNNVYPMMYTLTTRIVYIFESTINVNIEAH